MKKRVIYLSIFLISFLIYGCFLDDKAASFKVINKSINKIIDITISNGVNNVLIDVLKHEDSKQVTLDFEGVPKHDGGYYIRYNLDSKEYLRNFGYYSNGVPTNSIYTITIKKDTVLISEKTK